MTATSAPQRLALLGLIGLLGCAGVSAMERQKQESDGDFQGLRCPTYERVACSPDVPDAFQGLRIRVPRRVSLPAPGGAAVLDPAAPLLPVCGVVRLPNDELRRLGVHPVEDVILVFVDQDTGTPTSLDLVPDKPRVARAAPAPAGAPPTDPADDEAEVPYVFSQYFNVDVLMFRPDFPRRPARYRVHALLGTYRSEAVDVEVVGR